MAHTINRSISSYIVISSRNSSITIATKAGAVLLTTTAAMMNPEPGEDLMPEWGYVSSAVVLAVIGFSGVTLNLIVIVLMFKDLKLWTPMNIILFNLVCSDFAVAMIGNPLTFTAAIYHKWIFGNKMCIAYGFYMSLLGITSIITLAVLAYERYCLVSYPLSARNLTKRGAYLSICFIWLYASALTVPPLFGWGEYVSEAANISCSVNWESQTLNATSYIIFLFLFGLLAPVYVITFSYVNIIRTMRRNSRRLGRANRAERRVTLMVAVMILAFLVAWTPYAVFALCEQFGPNELITPGMAVLPALIAKSSICYNPLIYVGLNTQFRAALRRRMGNGSVIFETTVNQVGASATGTSRPDCAPNLISLNAAGSNQNGMHSTIVIEQNVDMGTTSQNAYNCENLEEGIHTRRMTTSELNFREGQSSTVLDEIIWVRSPDGACNFCDPTFENTEQNADNEFEMQVISCGKTYVIRPNSYTSNLG